MNTDWIVGCVVYAGLDTKVIQNQSTLRYKQSNIEKENNRSVFRLLVMHFVISFFIALLSVRWNSKYLSSNYYLNQSQETTTNPFLLYFQVFLLTVCLNSTFIPVSIIVAIEVIKLWQAWFMAEDSEMASISPTGKFQKCKLNTSALNEELGQVRYIFSDKTGTLTRNEMEFKLSQIGLHVYGEAETVKKLKKAWGQDFPLESLSSFEKLDDTLSNPSSQTSGVEIRSADGT